MRASLSAPTSAFSRLDLPTLLRPRNAISASASGGNCSGLAALIINRADMEVARCPVASDPAWRSDHRPLITGSLVRYFLFPRPRHDFRGGQHACAAAPSRSPAPAPIFSTSSIEVTKCSFISLRMFSGISGRSFSLSSGRITSKMPWRCAASSFSFKPANGQHAPAHRNFAGHGDIGAHRNAGQRAVDAGGDGDARRGPVFRDRALRNVQVNIEVPVKVARQSDHVRPAADVAHRRLRRFLHHVAQLAGGGQLARGLP